jgi:hypothetical protein
MAASINYDMDQGSNFAFTIRANDSNGNPVDLSTGCTAYSQMRKSYSSSTAITLNTSLTGGQGYILVSLGPTATAAIKAGTYFYDVELKTNSGNTVQRLVQGMITVYPEVTRV